MRPWPLIFKKLGAFSVVSMPAVQCTVSVMELYKLRNVKLPTRPSLRMALLSFKLRARVILAR